MFETSDGTDWQQVYMYPAPQDEFTENLQVFDNGLYSDAGSYDGATYAAKGPGAIVSSPNGALGRGDRAVPPV